MQQQRAFFCEVFVTQLRKQIDQDYCARCGNEGEEWLDWCDPKSQQTRIWKDSNDERSFSAYGFE